MGKVTNIAWTDSTLNLAWGCTKVSEECRNCYMYRMSPALGRDPYRVEITKAGADGKFRDAQIRKLGRLVFVNSMSDTFHPDIPFWMIENWLHDFERFPDHEFQILTKRPERAAWFFKTRNIPNNCWLGISCGIASAKPRIDILRDIFAPIRFVSFEPLLENLGTLDLRRIHWVIIGGESDRKNPRPMKPEWAESIIKQCVEQGVRVFFKQIGGLGGDNAGGCLLNGREIKEFPR